MPFQIVRKIPEYKVHVTDVISRLLLTYLFGTMAFFNPNNSAFIHIQQENHYNKIIIL